MSLLTIFNETAEDLSELETILIALFKEQLETKSFSVIFVTDEKIKELNKTYRNIDSETDVLSFPSDEDDYLGDVFISLEKARTQAVEYKHSLNREVGFLAVHGYLHLSGYDHKTKESEKKMNDLTEEILGKANLKRGI